MARRFVHEHLPYLLARASHALWRGFEPQVRAAGLNSLEWRVLATLYDGEPEGVGRLALEVLAKQPTVTKTLDRLQRQGWVQRSAHPEDARRSLVHITPAGRRQVAPLVEAAARHERRRLRELGAAGGVEMRVLRQQLALLVQRFDAVEDAGTSGV
ncbi:MAG: winged helix-turn-helix transcriptional regulator [Rubrivivax sp.]|nr:winged helix-turn-helix transcriptional regulator [Rubrivivax sp.]